MTVANTIDHITLLHLVTAGTVRGAQAIGQPGGWGVIVLDGTAERILTAKRGSARVFRKFETLAGYLKEVGIPRFQVDASHFDPPPITEERKRTDAAERLKTAHEAAGHDKWFREQVQAGLSDNRPTVSHDAVLAELRADINRIAQGGERGADEWSEAARQDAKQIVAYIAGYNPSAAYGMLDEIQSQAGRLAAHPNLGRAGRVDGTRELVIGRTPYIAIYQNRADHSLIVRVLHGAQQWPQPEGDEP